MGRETPEVERITADPDWYEPYKISLGLRVGDFFSSPGRLRLPRKGNWLVRETSTRKLSKSLATSPFSTTFADTLVAGEVADQPLDVFVAEDDEGAKETVAGLVRNGGLIAIDAGPLRRARELERLGFFGIALQQPLNLDFQSAWKPIS